MSKDTQFQDITEEQVKVRKLLQQFNEDLGVFINTEERFKLGRVLTIIDASFADSDQRKAVKDLVQNEWWNNNVRPSDTAMVNPHSDLRAICEVLGFELYPPSANQYPIADDLSWQKKRYIDVLATRT